MDPQNPRDKDPKWSRITLPNRIRSSTSPYLLQYRTTTFLLYKGVGNDKQIYVARSTDGRQWSISQPPRAFTNDPPTAAMYFDRNRKLGILVAYKGHNNNYIWLRCSTDMGRTWKKLGYIQGITSMMSPALEKGPERWNHHLAFQPHNSNDIRVGILDVDFKNPPDTAGHQWRLLE